MLHPHPSRRASSALIAFCLCGALALLVACGGGGSGGASASFGTGSVAVLVTDGPVDPDAFSHIFVTLTGITLIGPAGNVPVFEGSQTLDLRDLEDASTLVTLGRDVPARVYEKIRLDVSEIELVPADGGAPIFPKLPPKIDLNPRGSFRVEPGELLVVEIDLDAGKSIHIVETGNGGFIFRPVIFVDILDGPLHGKLVLLRGEVESVEEDGFLLCDTHPISRSDGAVRGMALERDDDDPEDHDDFCVDVRVDDDTSLFDESGDPIALGAVMPEDDAFVLGRFSRDGDEDLDFEAEVVQLGEDVLALDGEVASEVDVANRFDLELDPGQGIVTPDGLLAIQLQDGTKIFRRNGEPLDAEDILVGDPARAVGVLALSNTDDDVLKAAVVVIDIAATEISRIEGHIIGVANGGARLQVETDDASLCVDVPGDARIFEVTLDDNGANAEDIDRADLRVGDSVNVFGTQASPCFVAETLIVFVDEEDD